MYLVMFFLGGRSISRFVEQSSLLARGSSPMSRISRLFSRSLQTGRPAANAPQDRRRETAASDRTVRPSHPFIIVMAWSLSHIWSSLLLLQMLLLAAVVVPKV